MTVPSSKDRVGPRRQRVKHALGVAVLLLITVLQIRQLSQGFISRRTRRGWETRGYTAWERSALLSEGEGFLEFVSFLREVIPETGKVVFPPHSYISKAGPYTELDFMQYFMFPRQVLNCGEPVDDCVRTLTGPNSYIVAVGGFPPPEVAEEVKDYAPFRDEKGVYVPE